MSNTLEYDSMGAICVPSKSSSKNSPCPWTDIGKDCFQYTALQNSFGLCLFKFTPSQNITLREKMAETDLCTLSFCLGEGLEWSLDEAFGKQFLIERNESCILAGGTNQCISIYEDGMQYHGIGVTFSPSRMQGVADCLKCEKNINTRESLSAGLNRYAITPHIHAILSQLVDCKICGSLRDIYLEAKLLELIAVYLDEMIYQRSDECPKLPLSKDDLSALDNAKDILDKTFIHPMTLAKLSQKICLNEYKLKAGFKQRYGQTVYSYVLDKRMELARLLIGQRRFKICDIAGMVGYANTSHFITAFSKKYGATPGEFGKSSE